MGRGSKDLSGFGDALAAALTAMCWSQVDLGRALGGVTQGAISAWRSGLAEPSPATVFAAERALKVPPGDLSRHLGYLPLGPIPELGTVTAIERDPALSPAAKRSLVDLYHVLCVTEARRSDS